AHPCGSLNYGIVIAWKIVAVSDTPPANDAEHKCTNDGSQQSPRFCGQVQWQGNRCRANQGYYRGVNISEPQIDPNIRSCSDRHRRQQVDVCPPGPTRWCDQHSRDTQQNDCRHRQSFFDSEPVKMEDPYSDFSKSNAQYRCKKTDNRLRGLLINI